MFKTSADKQKLSFKEEDEVFFRVAPAVGSFEPLEIKTFELTYKCEDTATRTEFLSLFIDDIPWQALRNPPEGLALAN